MTISWGRCVVDVIGLAGFLLGARGVLGESFTHLGAMRPYGEGRYGEGPFGGQPAPRDDRLVRWAVAVRLLPADRAITIEDRRKNARLAIVGVVFGTAALVAQGLLDWLAR